jgi:hypothetical protein
MRAVGMPRRRILHRDDNNASRSVGAEALNGLFTAEYFNFQDTVGIEFGKVKGRPVDDAIDYVKRRGRTGSFWVAGNSNPSRLARGTRSGSRRRRFRLRTARSNEECKGEGLKTTPTKHELTPPRTSQN